jgi:alpha-maltose-1-phosphate synthase
VLVATDFLVKYSAGLARGLADGGAPTRLLTRSHDLEFGGRPGEMRAFVARVLDGRAEHVTVAGRVRELSSVPALARTWAAMRRFRPEVVHLQETIRNDPRLIVAAGALPGRYALTIHDPTPHPGHPERRAAFHRLRRGLVRGAGLIFVHAEALRDEVIEFESPSCPVVVVPHGVDEPAPSPLPDRPSVLFFGRIQVYKGLETLLDAMPLVWRRLPETTLTVAGDGEVAPHPVLADRRVTLRNEHVSERDVPGLYGGATCVALPYLQASQSGVGSLAKQFGRAMVASDVGGLPELVTPDVGRLVAPGDPAALAGALLDVLVDRRLAEAMGRAAAASVVEESGWRRVGELTLEAYERHLPRRVA